MTSPPTEAFTARLNEVAVVFLTFGFTAFGGPAAYIAMMRRELVTRRHWVSEERFLDLLVAGTMFILPAMLIVLGLAWLYTRLGTLPEFAWVFYGVKPVIIAIIVQALIGLARTAIKSRLLALVGLLAFILYLLTGNPILVLFGTGIFVILARAALVDVFTVAMAAVAWLVLQKFRINSAWLVLAGAILGVAARLVHLPL